MSIEHERIELLRKSVEAKRCAPWETPAHELLDLVEAVLDIIDGVPFNVPEDIR
jgi:hypothetical protein